MTVLDSSPIAELADQLVGPLFEPHDPGFTEEIATFNLAIAHRPALVVGATCAEDVAAAVEWAVAAGLPVAVQATGHGPVRAVEDAVLITTHRMRGVSIDASRRVARVEAGVRWHEVIAAAAIHGLAPLSGSSSDVGVVGYTLGGGLGPLARQYGFAADRVTRVTIVTADGRIRQASADSEHDLFWAVRGGKGNFGIVTELEFGLVPVTSVYGGALFFAAESTASVLQAYREWSASLPERSTTSIALLRMPDAPGLPDPLRGRFVVHLRFAHNGPADEGRALLEPMRQSGTVILDGIGDIPVTAFDSIHQDPTDPMPVWESAGLLRELTPAAIDRLVEVAGPQARSTLIMVEIRQLGGALARPAPVPNAVTGREGQYTVFVLGALAPEIAEAVPADGCKVLAALADWSTGTALLNFLGDATDPVRVATAWSEPVYRRLVAIKRAIDPDNVFRFGHALV